MKELEESSLRNLATSRKPLLRLQGELYLGTVLSPSPLLPLPHSRASVYMGDKALPCPGLCSCHHPKARAQCQRGTEFSAQ